MKTKKLSSAKTLLLASAGKLALAPGLASANVGSKGDEGPSADPAPQLGLHQVAGRFDAFIPPFNSDEIEHEGSMFEEELGYYDNAGIIFTGEIPDTGARMDFIVSHIRNDKPTDVFLVMGTQLAPDDEGDLFPGLGYTDMFLEPRAGARGDLEKQLDDLIAKLDELLESGAPLEEIEKVEKDIQKIERQFMKQPPDGQQGPGWKPRPGKGQKPPPVHAGEICVALDDANMEIIAGVRVHPSTPLLVSESIKLGKVIQPRFTSTIISIQLSKDKIQQFEGQEVFFQAASFPVGNPDDPLAETQVSECDRFLIAHIVEADEESGEEGMTGGKPDPDAGIIDGGNNGGKNPE